MMPRRFFLKLFWAFILSLFAPRMPALAEGGLVVPGRNDDGMEAGGTDVPTSVPPEPSEASPNDNFVMFLPLVER
jgi:hypothetical protein